MYSCELLWSRYLWGKIIDGKLLFMDLLQQACTLACMSKPSHKEKAKNIKKSFISTHFILE